MDELQREQDSSATFLSLPRLPGGGNTEVSGLNCLCLGYSLGRYHQHQRWLYQYSQY